MHRILLARIKNGGPIAQTQPKRRSRIMLEGDKPTLAA
jgi:hypothetical protein